MGADDGLQLWPDLVLSIDSSVEAAGRLRLWFRGVVKGTERVDFGWVEIQELSSQLNELLLVLNRWADPQQRGTNESVATHLEGLGSKLFQELLSPELRDFYWSRLDQAEGATVLIAADGDAASIPWELVKPGDNSGHTAPYWCEHLSLSRWFPDRPIAESLPGTPVACVLGDVGLEYVGQPVHEALGVSAGEVIRTSPDLLSVLKTSERGIFHWTGHGLYNPKNPSLSSLPIGGATFQLSDICAPSISRFFAGGPWVFVHACSSSRTAQGLLGIGGWPPDLIAAGAAAVIGTAWDVTTATAAVFGKAVYTGLLGGVAAGEAVRRARIAARLDNDPSWLAYQLYAHPGACMLRDRTRSQRTSQKLKAILNLRQRTTDDSSWRNPYLGWVAEHPHYTGEALVPLAGRAEMKGLDYTAIYVEPGGPRDAVRVELFKDLTDAIRQHKSVVLLGDSGAGKTATLYRVLCDFARSCLDGESDTPTPILVSLDEYRSTDTPLEFIRTRCVDTALKGRLDAELEARRICLLCDGLNDVPQNGYLKAVREWRGFISTYAGNRFVFACRTASYQNELHLQTVEINPLDDERIVRYLSIVVDDKAGALWESLQHSSLVELARMPLFLKWMVQSYVASGGLIPKNQALLVKGLVEAMIRREKEKGAYDALPLDKMGPALADCAYQMHSSGEGSTLGYDRALRAFSQAIPPAPSSAAAESETVMNFAVNVGLLQHTGQNIRFSQTQFRDFFAAVALKARWEKGEALGGYCRLARRTVSGDGHGTKPWDTVPPAPATVWDEPLVMASGMAGDPDRFITEICRVNPLLAGQCLTRGAAEVAGRMSSLVAGKIVKVIGDSRQPLPVRLGSGEILGRIGDPRFPVQKGGSGSYIAPQLIPIPEGLVNLGSDARDTEAFEDERPRRQVKVPAFEIARYPVTNAEYAQFVAAGGYDQSRYWTDSGWQWRQAWDNGEGSISRMLRNVVYFRGHTDDMEARMEETRAPEPERELWRALVREDDAAARHRLIESGRVRLRSKDKPAFFDHRRFKGANQPVVGVTWFEAMAYCSWLSETSGRRFLLPTEPQWERAAKGDSTSLYPWGDAWDLDRCNAASECILRTTPVGIFPKGRSPYGCEDMAGNVFEWTLSLYAPYPYTDAALREDPKAPGVRVNRGGGWDSPRRVARCALRGDMCDSQTYDSNLGFRLTAG